MNSRRKRRYSLVCIYYTFYMLCAQGGRIGVPECPVTGGMRCFHSLLVDYLSGVYQSGTSGRASGFSMAVHVPELELLVSHAGIISMIIAGGTIISSLSATGLIQEFWDRKGNRLCGAMTAAALFGFFLLSHSFLQLCVWASSSWPGSRQRGCRTE